MLGTRNLVEAAVATRGGAVRDDLHRQGGEPDQRHGRDQARGGDGGHACGAGAEERGSGGAGVSRSPLCPWTVARFGNVLGSRGSVVPFFQRQIAAGGPVTVTHPEMRRYFMTIPEAVQLVLQAAAIGKGGEVFALDMGEPVRIADLAHDLIRLSGLEPGRDIEMMYTGLRPGEKLFEELFLENEDYSRTRHEKIFVCRNGAEHVEGESLQVEVDTLVAAAQRGEAGEVRRSVAGAGAGVSGEDTATR